MCEAWHNIDKDYNHIDNDSELKVIDDALGEEFDQNQNFVIFCFLQLSVHWLPNRIGNKLIASFYASLKVLNRFFFYSLLLPCHHHIHKSS